MMAVAGFVCVRPQKSYYVAFLSKITYAAIPLPHTLSRLFPLVATNFDPPKQSSHAAA